MKYKKIVSDMVISIVSNCIPIIAMQIVILPQLSKNIDASTYGLAITIITIYSTVPEAFGGAINNIRLIKNTEYSSFEKFGDFTHILWIFNAISTAISLVLFALLVRTINLSTLFCFLFVVTTTVLKEYYLVEYRIRINYFRILINNIALTVGYFGGFILFLLFNNWQLVFVAGNTLQLVFLFSTTDIYKEKGKNSAQFMHTFQQAFLLLLSTMLFRLTAYADKFIVFPILGGEAVSIYYVSTLSGKIVSLLIGPIAGVMLTYLGKETSKNDRLFSLTLLVGGLVSLVGYVTCIIISKPILELLYPEYCSDALKYIFLTTGAASISALISLLNPFVMRFYNMKWQMLINGVSAITYILLCIIFAKLLGLRGVCIGSLLSILFRCIATIWIYYMKDSQKGEKKH